jgi:hypothetical protein
MIVAAAPLVAAPAGFSSVSAEAVAPVAAAVREPEQEPDRPALVVKPAKPRAGVETAAAISEPAAIREFAPIPMTEIAPPPVVTPPRPAAVAPEAPVVAPVSAPIPPPAAALDERLLVNQTLQRYRTAYEGLDAQSAHAVWPAVNQAALARAFDGLESQSLTFDACDVRVRGESAIAVCQGSARYVPKVGNRQPRTESRVWNFSLRKAGSDWKIDSARAER